MKQFQEIMKIYQNLGINEREEGVKPHSEFYEEIMTLGNVRMMKKAYGKKNALSIDLNGNQISSNYGLIGKNIYGQFMKEAGAKGLRQKTRLSKLEGKEVIATIVRDSPDRIVGIRPITPKKGSPELAS